jgi:hypothetical protein
MIATATADAPLGYNGGHFGGYIHLYSLNRTDSDTGITLDAGFVRNMKQWFNRHRSVIIVKIKNLCS